MKIVCFLREGGEYARMKGKTFTASQMDGLERQPKMCLRNKFWRTSLSSRGEFFDEDDQPINGFRDQNYCHRVKDVSFFLRSMNIRDILDSLRKHKGLLIS